MITDQIATITLLVVIATGVITWTTVIVLFVLGHRGR